MPTRNGTILSNKIVAMAEQHDKTLTIVPLSIYIIITGLEIKVCVSAQLPPWGQKIVNIDIKIKQNHSSLERFSHHSIGNALVQFGLLLGNEVCCEAR